MTFVAVFETALRLLSPFMPFITEEIWQSLYAGTPPERSIALAEFPKAAVILFDTYSLIAMDILQTLIGDVRAARKDLGVPEKEFVAINVFFEPVAAKWFQDRGELMRFLGRAARISGIKYADAPPTGPNVRSSPAYDFEVLYERTIDIPAERERLTRDLAKYEKGLASAERQLSNDAFLAKAPAHILEGLRKQAAETRTLYEKTKVALDALPAS
jgi:valyl-tRNA synthetase